MNKFDTSIIIVIDNPLVNQKLSCHHLRNCRRTLDAFWSFSSLSGDKVCSRLSFFIGGGEEREEKGGRILPPPPSPPLLEEEEE